MINEPTILTPDEWRGLSARSRHGLNVMQIQLEQAHARIGAAQIEWESTRKNERRLAEECDKLTSELAQARARIAELEGIVKAAQEWMGKAQVTFEDQAVPCKWKRVDDQDSSEYNAACGLCFIVYEGGLEDNQMVYCPGCGRKILEVIPEEEPEDEE